MPSSIVEIAARVKVCRDSVWTAAYENASHMRKCIRINLTVIAMRVDVHRVDRSCVLCTRVRREVSREESSQRPFSDLQLLVLAKGLLMAATYAVGECVSSMRGGVRVRTSVGQEFVNFKCSSMLTGHADRTCGLYHDAELS